MDTLFEIDEATLGSGLAPAQELDATPAKRRVVCDGVKGVLAKRDGRWVLENEAELAVLEALGGRSDGLGRLRGITAALNSPAAGAGDVTNLNGCLRSIANAVPVWTAGVSSDLMAATAVACAYWDYSKAIEWLCWALSVRYGDNLNKASAVGPGWDSFSLGGRNERNCGHRRDGGWLRWVGDDFWIRLATHESPVVREFAEAINPNTSPARIAELWGTTHDEVLDAIASRPDFSEIVLRGAASENLGNPRHSRSLLIYRIAQNLSLSSEDLYALARQDRENITHATSQLLMNHPNANDETLDKIAVGSCRKVASWVGAHPIANSSTVDRVLNYHSSFKDIGSGRCPHCLPIEKVRAAAAANPAMPTETLSRIVDSPLNGLRAAVAINPSTAVADLEKLAGDRRREVRASVAANPKVPTRLLEELALDRTAVVREFVVANPKAPVKLLAQLAFDVNPVVRRRLASRDHTPEAVLEMLTSDTDNAVRYWVANHQSAPQSSLAQLASDPNDVVRSRVAHNPSASAELLAQLANDSDMWIREHVASNPSSLAKVLKQLASDPEPCVREAVARHPKTPKSVLSALASDPQLVVRDAVAANPSTPSRVLEQLAREDDQFVLDKLARNPSTPTALLERLAQSEWARVFHPALDALTKRRQEDN